MKTIIAKWSEIHLKKGNKKFFVKKLNENLREKLQATNIAKIIPQNDRVLVETENPDETWAILSKTFGIQNVSEVESFPIDTDFDEIAKKAAENLENEENQTEILSGSPRKIYPQVREFCRRRNSFEKGFCVRVTRSDKNYPLKSTDIERQIGGKIKNLTGKTVDLTHGEKIEINFTHKNIFLAKNTRNTAGGLPVGTAGKVIALLSGGFDSPAAAWMIAKRGATVHAAHFHSYPHLGRESIEKVQKLQKILQKWDACATLTLFPFLDLQKFFLAHAQKKDLVILYRRSMLRLANRLAARKKAKAIVTGDTLAQVASQTLQNMSTINFASEKMVLRPLAGFDKQEIITLAAKIGTADISAQAIEDCCSLFVPQHPELFADLAEIEQIETKLREKGLDDIENTAWESRES